jgi:hypothetical protein
MTGGAPPVPEVAATLEELADVDPVVALELEASPPPEPPDPLLALDAVAPPVGFGISIASSQPDAVKSNPTPISNIPRIRPGYGSPARSQAARAFSGRG